MSTDAPQTIVEELISLPSYVANQTNEALMSRYIERYIQSHCPQFTVIRQRVIRGRDNLIVTNGDNPLLVFVCHMDTVQPVDGAKDILVPRKKGGYIYGLGAVDMKGGIAALLSAVVQNKNKRIACIFDCDEEYYFAGAKKILEQYAWKPKLVVCPEPTGMEIVNGCRGVIEIMCNVIGKTAHAGTPEYGINAIELALHIVSALKKSFMRFDEKYLGRTTVNLSWLNGGRFTNNSITAQGNAVPDIARLLLDIRPASRIVDARYVLQDLRTQGVKQCRVTIDYPAYISARTSMKLLERSIADVGGVVRYRNNLGCGGFYEAALFSHTWDCPAVSYGPGPAVSAHTIDERVRISDLNLTTRIFERLCSLFG